MTIKPLLVSGVLAGLLLMPAPTAQAFSDTQTHWAQNDIDRLVSLEAIGGYEDGTFRPDQTITRAEFSKILSKSLALPPSAEVAFTDTADHWARNDLSALVQAQILIPAEYGGVYSPDTPISRSEIAIMLVRAAGLDGQAAALSGTAIGFSDDDSIAAYNRGYISLARQQGFIGGYEDGSFRPQATATRAEAAAMIMRLLDAQASLAPSPAPSPSPTPAPEAEPETGEQTSEGLVLSIEAITASPGWPTNSLGEQMRTTTFSLKVHNPTAAPLSLSSQQLRLSAIYNQNGLRREAPVRLDAFTLTVPAGATIQQAVTARTILPTSLAAQLALGSELTGYSAVWQNGGHSTPLSQLAAALSAVSPSL